MDGFSKLAVQIAQDMLFGIDSFEPPEKTKWWTPGTIVVRLSTSKCNPDGVGWSEITNAGYAPVNIADLVSISSFSSPYIGTTGMFLGSDSILFYADEDWEGIRQVGFWLSETELDADLYFIGGAELSDTIYLNQSDSLVFKTGVENASSLSLKLTTSE